LPSCYNKSMKQESNQNIPRHLGIILDGNPI